MKKQPGSKLGYGDNLKCPECSTTFNRVIDSRSDRQNTNMRRRRLCENGHRFTTYERIGDRQPSEVVSIDAYRSAINCIVRFEGILTDMIENWEPRKGVQ